MASPPRDWRIGLFDESLLSLGAFALLSFWRERRISGSIRSKRCVEGQTSPLDWFVVPVQSSFPQWQFALPNTVLLNCLR